MSGQATVPATLIGQDQAVKTTSNPTFASLKCSNLTSGKIPIASTNGLLVNGQTPLSGVKEYFVGESYEDTNHIKLTFTNGVLTAAQDMDPA